MLNTLSQLRKQNFESPPRPVVCRGGATQEPTDRFQAGYERLNLRADWRRVAALSLSAFGALAGVVVSTPTAVSMPIQGNVQATDLLLDKRETLEQLKAELRESFGRAPRTRAETFRRLDSLQEKGILQVVYPPTGRTVLAELSLLNGQSLARGVHRRNLMRDVVRHLDNPELMKQGERDTCAAAGIQHLLAHRDPAQYLHLIRGLVSPSGSAITREGRSLRRVEQSIDDNSGRSEVSSIFQSALMDFANGPESYSNRDDVSTGVHDPHLHEANPYVSNSGHQEGGHPGLFPNEISRALSAFFPGPAQTVFVAPEAATAQRNVLQQILSEGGIVVTGVRWGEGSHLLVVQQITPDGVIAWNPWGEPPTVSRPSRDPFDNMGGGMMPMMMSYNQNQVTPEFENLTETGRIKMGTEEFFSRLQSFEWVSSESSGSPSP